MRRYAGCFGVLGLLGLALAGVTALSMSRGEGLDTWPLLCVGSAAVVLFGGSALGMMAGGGKKRGGFGNPPYKDSPTRGGEKDQVDTRQIDHRVVLSRGAVWMEGGQVMADRSREYLIFDGYVIGEPGVTYPNDAPVLLPGADGCYHLPGVVLNGVELGGAVLAPEFFNQWRDGNA